MQQAMVFVFVFVFVVIYFYFTCFLLHAERIRRLGKCHRAAVVKGMEEGM